MSARETEFPGGSGIPRKRGGRDSAIYQSQNFRGNDDPGGPALFALGFEADSGFKRGTESGEAEAAGAGPDTAEDGLSKMNADPAFDREKTRL